MRPLIVDGTAIEMRRAYISVWDSMNDPTTPGDPPAKRPRAKSLLRRLARILALVYLGTLGVLMMLENRLIYPAPAFNEGVWSGTRKQTGAQEIELVTERGAPATAWLFPPAPTAPPAEQTTTGRFGMYFHGNGENLAYTASFARRLADEMQMTVLAVEYPGYDQHGTKVSEAGIYQNAKAGLDWLCEQQQIEPTDVVLLGRSLGGGVAMSLAQASNSRAIVLLSTFSSLPDVAAEKYPLFPIRLVMRNRFPSRKRMQTCTQPLLQFHGDEDSFVPITSAKRLFESSPAPQKRFVTLEGRGHNDSCPELFWSELKLFLEQLDPVDTPEPAN
jgi:fermentation-respiration switch protein FrsA (DUF1100 family)